MHRRPRNEYAGYAMITSPDPTISATRLFTVVDKNHVFELKERERERRERRVSNCAFAGIKTEDAAFALYSRDHPYMTSELREGVKGNPKADVVKEVVWTL